MSYFKRHYVDSMLAAAWTCSECGEDTYESDSYPAPRFCCHCGTEIVAVDNPIRLIAGEMVDVTPESWKSNPPQEPARGTITVKSDESGTSCTVNLVSKNGELNEP